MLCSQPGPRLQVPRAGGVCQHGNGGGEKTTRRRRHTRGGGGTHGPAAPPGARQARTTPKFILTFWVGKQTADMGPATPAQRHTYVHPPTVAVEHARGAWRGGGGGVQRLKAAVSCQLPGSWQREGPPLPPPTGWSTHCLLTAVPAPRPAQPPAAAIGGEQGRGTGQASRDPTGGAVRWLTAAPCWAAAPAAGCCPMAPQKNQGAAEGRPAALLGGGAAQRIHVPAGSWQQNYCACDAPPPPPPPPTAASSRPQQATKYRPCGSNQLGRAIEVPLHCPDARRC